MEEKFEFDWTIIPFSLSTQLYTNYNLHKLHIYLILF